MTDEKLEELNSLSHSIKVRKIALEALDIAKKVNGPSVTVFLSEDQGPFRKEFTICGELAEELISVIRDKVEEHKVFLEEQFEKE